MTSLELVLGFIGQVCAGKGLVIKYLVEKYGFVSSSCSDRIREELVKKNQEITRENLQEMAGKMRKTQGAAVLALKTWQKLAESGAKKMAIDSIRGWEEVEFFKKIPHFYLISIEADQKIRFARMLDRAKKEGRIDSPSWEDFIKDEERDLTEDGRDMLACFKAADFILNNNGTKEELYQQIDQLLSKL